MSDKLSPREGKEPIFTLRMYLLIKALEEGVPYYTAQEAVSSTLMDKPNVDPALRTYAEWEKRLNKETE